MNKQIVKKEPNRNFRVGKYSNCNEKNYSWVSTAGFVGFKQKEENKQFENKSIKAVQFVEQKKKGKEMKIVYHNSCGTEI